MKITLISFLDKDDNNIFETEETLKLFESNGYPITSLLMVSSVNKADFKKTLVSKKSEFDNIVVVDNNQADFSIKEIIADVYKTGLVENSGALSFISEFSEGEEPEKAKEYAVLPITSTLIPNVNGVYQGFYIEEGKSVISLLPSEFKQFSTMCESYLFPYFDGLLKRTVRKETIKYFGQRKELTETLNEAKKIAGDGFSYNLKERNGDFTVNLFFSNFSDTDSGKIICSVRDKLKDKVYAENNQSLAERLFNLLKEKGLRLSTAESFTGGRIVSAIVNNSGASDVLTEGIVCYSNQSKIKRLNVKEEDIKTEGAVSSKVVYQMAVGLLNENGTDLAISTTGIAGPNTDESGKPVGLCYVGVGMKDGVHTYKLNLKGSREEITERAKNTALFLSINRIKNL